MSIAFDKNNMYLQISLTDKCNLQCVYCKYENINNKTQDNLSFDDYKFLIKSISELGIKKIKFTGGEPLLYPRIMDLIRFARVECNINDISISTNGILYYEMIYNLKDAGITSVDISIDTLKEYRYKSVTNGGTLKNILKSVELSLKLGIHVNVNCVVIDGFNIDEIYDFMLMTNLYTIDVNFRELIPRGKALKIHKEAYFNIQRYIEDIEGLTLINTNLNNSYKYYVLNNAKGKIGIVSSDVSSLNNNKIRIDYTGKMKVGKDNNGDIDIREYLQRPMIFRETMKDII